MLNLGKSCESNGCYYTNGKALHKTLQHPFVIHGIRWTS